MIKAVLERAVVLNEVEHGEQSVQNVTARITPNALDTRVTTNSARELLEYTGWHFPNDALCVKGG
jgi:hypothetical protein